MMQGSRTEAAMDDGVRRRRSAYTSEDDEGCVDTQIISQEDARLPPDHDSQRVRFSLDECTRHKPLMASKKRKSDEMLRNTDAVGQGSRLSPLTVDTGVAAVMSGANNGGVSHLASPSSPLPKIASPRSERPRGFSLRSRLFGRGAARRPSLVGSTMEMQAVDPSHDVLSSGVFSTPDYMRKGKQTSVTVTAAEDLGPSERAPPPAYQSSSNKAANIPAPLATYRQWLRRKAHRVLPMRHMRQTYYRVNKFIMQEQEIPPSKNGRHIPLDPSRKKTLIDERTGTPHIRNDIRSSKYNAWNFVPRQLFYQYSKLANFYILLISVMQMIPGFSTTGQYTTIIPIMFFVFLSMGKEGYEDLRRHRLDKAENNRQAKVLHAYQPVEAVGGGDELSPHSPGGPLHWASVKWQSVRVGDVVKLGRDDAAPADLVLLSSTGPNNLAYVETMALDGETNLKNKQPPAALVAACCSPEAIAKSDVHFVVEDPNLDLYSFEGRVTVKGETAPLTNNEIIYRGSVLRNTPEAVGMVIYSGEECKIRMNANKNPRIKAPSLQFTINRIVILIVCFVIAISVFLTAAHQVWVKKVQRHAWYLRHARVPFSHIVTSFIIMFNTLVPLSLYVSMEIIKLAQIFLMNDVDMYDEKSNTPFEARTSTINEELGQVSYIFSDKTGTLTDNDMKFRKLSVAGTAWLHDVDLPVEPETARKPSKRSSTGKGKMPLRQDSISKPTSNQIEFGDGGPSSDRRSTAQWSSPAMPNQVQPDLSTREMIRYVQQRPDTAFAQRAKMMVLSMALCHTCLPERASDGSVSFQASSPDELALVRAAQELDYLVYDRQVSTLSLRTLPDGPDAAPRYESYEVLDVIDFSSKRKRMSIVMRFPDGRICVLCKGADTIVMQRLRLAALASQKLAEVEKRTSQRRSMEAQVAIQRKSTQLDRHGSVGSFSRTNTALPTPRSAKRQSFGRLEPICDNIDEWLVSREQDVTSPVDSAAYSRRPSAPATPRISTAVPENGAASGDVAQGEDLVEEALVVDDEAVIERCFQHINDFATEGLRTLLYGYRFLDEDEYRSWKKIYQDASTSLVDRQLMIERAGELIEQQLELAGATAIEDKLQEGVPETIDRLRRANIKMWMLTGDKRETAINIGHSCRLIKDYSAVTILDHEAGNVEHGMASAIIDINRGIVAHSVVVVDGATLGTIMTNQQLHAMFLDLAVITDSVICCRASPSQKAGLVSAIRYRVDKSVTLAIGDGANDIAMIQEAHVGIGITGKEGLQAARTSDYSIAQFRFLTKLLLVHGRWNYIRTCKYTVGTFWKEMLFYLVQAVYQRYAGYTGTSLYEPWSISMFNTLFTSLPIIFLGIFEQDLHAATLIAVPELYTKGQRCGGFNIQVYFAWMVMAASEAVIIFYIMYGVFALPSFTRYRSLFAMGDLVFTAVVIVIATKLQVLEQRYKSFLALLAWFLALGAWFLWNMILSQVYRSKDAIYDVRSNFVHHMGKNALWWFTVALAVAACLFFEVGVRALKSAFWPTDVEVFQTLEQDPRVRRRFEEAAAPWLAASSKPEGKASRVDQRSIKQKREGEGNNKIKYMMGRARSAERLRVPSKMETAHVETEEQAVMVEDGPQRKSADIQEMLSRRFGDVKRESLASVQA